MTPNPDTSRRTAARQRLRKLRRRAVLLQCATTLALVGWIGQALLGFFGAPFVMTMLLIPILGALSALSEDRSRRYEKRSRAIRQECAKCKYDLAGLGEGLRCPECGEPVVLPPGTQVP